MAEISSLLGLITDDQTRQALIAQMENMFDNAPDEERLIQEIGNPTKVAVALIRYADSGKITPAAAPVVAPAQAQPRRAPQPRPRAEQYRPMTAAAAQRPAPSFTFPDLPEEPDEPETDEAPVLDGQLSFDEQPADNDGYYDEQPAADDGYYDEQPAADDGYYDEQPAEDDGYYDEQPGEEYGEEYDEEYYDDYEPEYKTNVFLAILYTLGAIIIGVPVFAVLLAIFCNVLWGSAFPFIKLGYRLFAIDSADTASILCFAGVRFMMGAALVWLAGLALNRRPLPMPRGKTLASACGLGLWQTAAQYFFYYSAVALLTGAMGGILNSTQSFMGVILAHFLYGNMDRLTPRKALGCALGFGGVLVATLGNHGGGSVKGMAFMLIASVIFALAGPWNKAVTQHADSFSVSVLNLGVGGLALAVLGFAMGGSLHPQSAAGIPVLLFLAFISGAGYVIWALLMKNNPVSRIAVFGLIIPIMNVLLSALLNGEPLFEWNYLAALVLVCIGIFLVNRAPQTQETKA